MQIFGLMVFIEQKENDLRKIHVDLDNASALKTKYKQWRHSQQQGEYDTMKCF